MSSRIPSTSRAPFGAATVWLLERALAVKSGRSPEFVVTLVASVKTEPVGLLAFGVQISDTTESGEVVTLTSLLLAVSAAESPCSLKRLNGVDCAEACACCAVELIDCIRMVGAACTWWDTELGRILS